MPTVNGSLIPQTGYKKVTMNAPQADAQFATQPVAEDQILYPEDISVTVNLDITGLAGTYDLYHIIAASGSTVHNSYDIAATSVTASANGTLNSPADKTTVTLTDPLETSYSFQEWPAAEIPVAGEQLITITNNGAFDTAGNYITESEGIKELWYIRNDGMTFNQKMDYTGLAFAGTSAGSPPVWDMEVAPPVSFIGEPGSYNISSLVSGETSISLTAGTLPAGYSFDGTDLIWDGTTTSNVYSGFEFTASNADGSSTSNTFSIAVLTETGCLLAPALPAPSGNIVNVSTVTELVNALNGATVGDTILLAAGTYDISNANPAVSVADITLRSATDACDDVIIQGTGQDTNNGTQMFGFFVDAAGFEIDFITIRDTWSSSLQLSYGAQNPKIYGCRLFNAGEQFVKSSFQGVYGDGNDNGIVEYCVLEYTDGLPTVDHGGGVGYTNGVDVHGGANWQIRKNVFKNITNPDTADNLWVPAILMWNGAADTITEQNIFINCDRDIAYGLKDETVSGGDHQRGIIRNNVSFTKVGHFSSIRKAASDGKILGWSCPDIEVYHNTIITNGNYNSSIELRWDSGSAAAIKNNLTDVKINFRDGATADQSGNKTDATLANFIDAPNGDFRLDHQISPLVSRLANVLFDHYDTQRNEQTDPGHDQYEPFGEPVIDPPVGIKPFILYRDGVAQTNLTGVQIRVLDGTAINSPSIHTNLAATTDAAGNIQQIDLAGSNVLVGDPIVFMAMTTNGEGVIVPLTAEDLSL